MNTMPETKEKITQIDTDFISMLGSRQYFFIRKFVEQVK